MPNHVKSIMTLSADTDERIQEVFDFIRGEKSEDGNLSLFDFNKVIPKPHCLATMGNAPFLDTSYPLDADETVVFKKTLEMAKLHDWQMKWELQGDDWNDEKFMKRIKDMAAKDYQNRIAAAARVAETGYPDWYEWANAKWGTKWNSYENEYNGHDSITFWTAWSCPILVIEALSKKFPDVEIRVEYASEDIGLNCGSITLENGEVLEEVNYPYGHDCINFCCDVWGYDDYNRARHHCWCEDIDPDEHPEALEEWGYVDEEKLKELEKAEEILLEETDIFD